MVNAFILVAIAALVIITGKIGGPGAGGADDRRHDVPPTPGREGR